MADNEHVYDDDVRRITAMDEYERLYYRGKLDAAWSPSKASTPTASSKSISKSEASGSRVDADDETTPAKAWHDEGEGSEYADDAHQDNISSDNRDNILRATYEDAEGRPGTDPEGNHPRILSLERYLV